jgi:hypothetical protein
MNLLTHVMHLVGSGAVAYNFACQIRDPLTRPNVLAGFQLAESGSVPFLEAFSHAQRRKEIFGLPRNLLNMH